MAGTNKSGTRPRSADKESGYESDPDLSYTIKRLERLSLEDDGKRNWREESINYLDEHHKEWKDLKTTVMVPPCLQLDPVNKTTGEKTEKKFFDLLKDFGEKYHEPMFVVHSYSFSELIDKFDKGYENETKKEWVKGEHDFVIIHRQYGAIFLEVKSRENTKGVYKEGLRQIEKARNATLSYLKKIYGKSKGVNKASYDWPGFVVMPNCEKTKQDNPHDNVVYKEDCFSPESFKEWWDDKIADALKEIIDSSVYEELVIRFVPFSCLLPTLNLQIDKTHENIVKIFTPRQLEAWYNSCPVQWFTGPAGSGKTVLVIEKAKEIASKIKERGKMERILVLCFNRPLSIHLENEINGWFNEKYDTESPVTIKTYDAFIKEVGGFGAVKEDDSTEFEKRRNEVEATDNPPDDKKYEHIFVDEGQDLSGNKWPKFLEKLHNKPDVRSRYFFWVMFDSNQHVQLSETQNLPWDYLRNATQLKYVFRNTKNIFSLSEKYYEDISKDGEIQLGHNEIGLDIFWDQNLKQNRSNRAELVVNHIQNLQDKKVKARDMAVLEKNEDYAFSLNEELGCKLPKRPIIRRSNAEERLTFAKNAIAVDSIRRFKGLESKVVILCDPECYPRGEMEKTRQLLYTAVSRCFCYLIIVSTPDGCKRIKNVSTHISPHSAGFSSHKDKRKNETPVEQVYASVEKKHKQEERHSTFDRFGKRSRENQYESGPPERRDFVDKTDKESSDDETISPAVKISPMEVERIEQEYKRKKKSKQSRPINVDGSDLLEPGDEFIKDNIRSNAFSLLGTVVKKNLTFTATNYFTEEGAKKCISKIEYETYKTHRAKQNSGPYTKAMRTLKRDIERDNNQKQLNSEVNKALNQQ